MSNSARQGGVIATLPREWENEETFHDVLYEWMSRAPWVLISAAMHVVVALILAAIPWSVFEPGEEQKIIANLDQPIEQPPEVPPETPVELDPEDVEQDPIIEEFDIAEPSEDDPTELSPTDEGDPTADSDSPFDDPSSNALLGIGGDSGNKYGNRFDGGDGKGRRRGRRDKHVTAGLDWLAAHQDEDGGWDTDGFGKHDPADAPCDGRGLPLHDVGVTGLALLAYLGDGHSMVRGDYKDVVKNGVKYLLNRQDSENGLLGDSVGHSYLYDHAIASLALCEVYAIDRSITVRSRAQKAIDFISLARNPYGVWRYHAPPDGDEDTSVTGWMVFALKAADDAGLRIDETAYATSIAWFDRMTDPGTGRVGYTEPGSASSRVPGLNEHYPTDRGEAMTAVALLCRFFLGQTPEDEPLMERHAELLAKTPPKWDPEGLGTDMYYWYYGSYAMYQMGGRYWSDWSRALEGAVLESQRQDGSARGSWDPVGPWGHAGGRVYSTATMILCLETYYRYSRVTGMK